MIVPQYWAEARIQHRKDGKQVTMRRFGWSDTSEADAQSMAEMRAREALKRVVSGEKLMRSEPKVPYHGAEGVPIREEIVSRHGETIITRNAYGARCLNTPNVLFADIDYARNSSFAADCLFAVIGGGSSMAVGLATRSMFFGMATALAMLCLLIPLGRYVQRTRKPFKDGAEIMARDRIGRFLTQNPSWNFRLYQTPAGLRILATHRLFQPNDQAVSKCFEALDTDPVYTRMCLNQQCFRARVSAKPWRIGIDKHMRPRPGTWPVHPDRVRLRIEWIEGYEAVAKNYAACRFIESIGSGVVHPDVKATIDHHDSMCQATVPGLPLA